MDQNTIDKIKNIFTQDNIPAILAVINHVRPVYTDLCKESEYLTVVNAAKLDAVHELTQNIINYVQEEVPRLRVGDRKL